MIKLNTTVRLVAWIAAVTLVVACGGRVFAQANGGAVVTDPMFKVVMTLPADVMVDPGADLSPVVTGTATATATTTPTPVVSHEDSAITPLNLGLNALFLLDDAASAMVIQDFSGNGFLGTNHEAVTGTAGKVGGALHFNGTSQYLDSPEFSGLGGHDARSSRA